MQDFQELKDLLAGIKKEKQGGTSDEVMSVGQPAIAAETAQINQEAKSPYQETPEERAADVAQQQAATTVPGQIAQTREIASVLSTDPAEQKVAQAAENPYQSIMDKMDTLRVDRDQKVAEAQSDDRNKMLLANAIKALGNIGQAEVQRNAGVDVGMDKFKAVKGPDTATAIEKRGTADIASLQDQLKMLQSREMTPYQKAMLEDRAASRESREKIASEKKRATPVKLSVGEEQVDKEFGKEYNKWNTAGRADYDVNKKIFDDAINKLKTKEQGGTGEVETGFLEGIGARIPGVRTETREVEDTVRKAINGMLRATLGSQFTEKEGERIFGQTFDPSASAESNVDRMELEIAKLDKRKEIMDDMGTYFKANKTMSGYEPGELKQTEYTSDQKKAPHGDTVERNGKQYKWNPRAGKYQPLK